MICFACLLFVCGLYGCGCLNWCLRFGWLPLCLFCGVMIAGFMFICCAFADWCVIRCLLI